MRVEQSNARSRTAAWTVMIMRQKMSLLIRVKKKMILHDPVSEDSRKTEISRWHTYGFGLLSALLW